MRVLDDTRQAFRFFRKTLRSEFGATAATLVTLGVAIAANAVIFSIGNALLFKAAPGVESPSRLVYLGRTGRSSDLGSMSYPDYMDYRNRNNVFSGVAAYSSGQVEFGLRAGAAAEQVGGLLVSDNFFEVLGNEPALGRYFVASDDDASATPVAVVSYELWQRRFGGNGSVAGIEILLNGRTVNVVGVAPEGFHGPDLRQTDIWVPLSMESLNRRDAADVKPAKESRTSFWLVGVARLKDGVSMGQAQANVSLIAAQLRQEYYQESNREIGAAIAEFSLLPAAESRALKLFLIVLLSMAGIILLIACANVAGIGLARAVRRKREVALRITLGATRARVITQLLGETLALFIVAGSGGLLVAGWITSLVARFKGGLPVALAVDLAPDARVVLFTLCITLLAALAAGITPALSAARADLSTALKKESSTATHRGSRLRMALVVAQVSLSLVLLTAAGLFLRTVVRADLTRPGFDPADVQVMPVDFNMAGLGPIEGQIGAGALLRRVRSLPGVEAASLAMDLPLDLAAVSLGSIRAAGDRGGPGAAAGSAEWNVVTPGFFETIRLPLLRGRDFTEEDRSQTRKVGIINVAMAEQFWPGEDPIGKYVYRDSINEANAIEVIGVVKSVPNRSLGETPAPFIYVPFSQEYRNRVNLLVRASARGNVISALREAVGETNPNLPLASVRRLQDIAGLSLVPQRVGAWLVGTMGLAGVLLACLGIYGVTTQVVSSRVREIGIRIALGAQSGGILRLTLREAVMISATGIVLGLIGALAAGRLIRSYLYTTGAADPLAFGVAIMTVAAAVLLASYVPARKATQIDPMVSLRHE